MKLELLPTAQKKFLNSVAAKQKATDLKRIAPAFKNLGAQSEERRDLMTDIWRVIADWYHDAIMELTFTEDFNSDPKWISPTCLRETFSTSSNEKDGTGNNITVETEMVILSNF